MLSPGTQMIKHHRGAVALDAKMSFEKIKNVTPYNLLHSVLLLVILIITVRAKLKQLRKDRTVLIGNNAFHWKY